jgi:bifunctional DNase/RNase
MATQKKSRKKIIIVSIILLLVVLLAVCLASYFANYKNVVETPELLLIPQLSTRGYMQVSTDAGVIGDAGIITLTSDCYQLVANTEVSQAISIFNGLEKKIDFRPNTHDLMKDAFDNFGIEVLMVRITDLKNDTFTGELILKQSNNIINFDSKPSDGIALAIRTGAPIFIKENLMKENGEYIC